MEYRLVGRTGLRVSAIGLGCGGFGGVGSEVSLFGKGESEEEAFALMDRAVELGINYLDTADSYGGGRSEEMVGRWLKSRGAREQVVLGTKVLNPMGTGVNGGGLSRHHLMSAIDASLRRLQTDHVDIYLAHGMDPDTGLQETIRAFDDLVTAGKVRYAGACNIEAWRAMKALCVSERQGAVRFECIQNEYNLLHREAEREMLPLVVDQRLAFMAYSPIAGGWLTGKYSAGADFPSGSRMQLRPDPYASLQTAPTFRALDGLRSFASEYGASMGALALAWARSHPAVTCALAGPRNLKQFETVAEAIELSLSVEDREGVAASLMRSEAPVAT